MLDKLLDTITEAVVADLSSEVVQQQLRRNFDFIVGRYFGLNPKAPLVKPYVDDIYDRFNKQIMAMVEVAEEAPDEAADLIKDSANDFANSFSTALKARIAKKNTSESRKESTYV